ncbi:TolC family protein [Noviherbaspirillum humi]|nr:TolC family protein [Noviherbaspirillum humi]
MTVRRGCAALALLLGAAARAQDDYPALLPPEPAVRAALDRTPEVRAARARIDFDSAESRRLRTGAHEWVARATVQRRTEADGLRYREQGVALERPVRWFGKAGKDGALADQQLQVAQFAYADAWHEAGRAFLRLWFDAIREARAAALLQEQVKLLEQQAGIAAKRVKAGDAPRMDMMLAETERDRLLAVQQQAMQRAERTRLELDSRYPGLPLAMPAQVPAPNADATGIEQWVQRIVSENHEIELADAQAAFARLAAQRRSLERTPDPTVGVHMMQERDRQEKIVGVTVSIPLPGAVRAAQADASAAEAAVVAEKAQGVRFRVQREAAAAAMSARAAYDNWASLARLAQRSRDTAALLSKAYSLGEVTIGEALLARRQSLEAEASAEAAQVEALQARAALMLDAHLFWEAQEDAPTQSRP